MDHLSSELGTLVALARMERPTAAEKNALFQGVLRTLEQRGQRVSCAPSASEWGGGRGLRRFAQLVGCAVTVASVIFAFRFSDGPARPASADSNSGLRPLTSSALVVPRAEAAKSDPSASAGTYSLLGAAEHAVFAHRAAARRGLARHRAGSHGLGPLATKGEAASLRRSEARGATAVSQSNAAAYVAFTEAPAQNTEPTSRAATELTNAGRGNAGPDTAQLPSSPLEAGAQLARRHAEERRNKLRAEAAARYSAALGERARLASACRPLSSVAWY
jgi:hypothetical protein